MILLTLILLYSLTKKGKFNIVSVFSVFFKKIVLLTNKIYLKAEPQNSKNF